ncbi:trypsin-like peptidase domain-containing protein [Amycolatopsis sp. lyj-108]|uniref:nSTAND1 domain-containing NTPase n=1 Tax=Amycolatopsis sp. lyj-108 TaxID=2789286 RepID=UPI00397E25E8
MNRRYVDRAGFLVRVLAVGNHQPVGVGFLVDGSHLVTCAHVINTALGRPERTQDAPEHDVRVPVDFPLLGNAAGAPIRLCQVSRWLPPPVTGTTGDDIAGLTVVGEDVPRSAGAARLPEELAVGSEAHVFGQPAARHGGAWATARVRGRVGGDMLQVDSELTSAVRLQPGYSGSPLVVSEKGDDVVVGMLSVASTRDDRRDAYGIPVDRLIEAWPEVLAVIPPCPYPGLRPFTSADEGIFVGREDDVERLLSMVETETLALVVGPSGIGKSSLVNAGLIPRWRASGGIAVTIRPGPSTARPRESILLDLEAALRVKTGQDVWDLGTASGGLIEAVARRAGAIDTSILIHFDQFEELLAGTRADERAGLIDFLFPVSRDVSQRCRVVATMRADFLPSLLGLPGLGPRIEHGVLLLSPMSVPALERAITEPARACGVDYEAGLAGQIAADAGGGPGSLPLMGFTLSRLWQNQRQRRLTFSDYHEFGGVTGAINRYAERVHQRLGADSEVKAIMLALVRTRGGAAEAGGRAVPLDRFEVSIVDDLVKERLLVVDSDGVPLVRLAHESLIRSWSRFARWVDEDADFQRWLATVEERAADDDLLSESHIGAAEQWLDTRKADIPAEVVHLVERSRTVWRQRIAEVEAARAEAEARRLAAASELATATTKRGRTVPLTLAIESIRTMWTLEGDGALRRAMRTAPVVAAEIPEAAGERVFARLTTTGSHLIREVVNDSGNRMRRQMRLYDLDGTERYRRDCALVHLFDGQAAVRFGPDGRLAVRTDGKRVTVAEVESGADLFEDHGRIPVISTAFSRDGTTLAVVRGTPVESSRRTAFHETVVTVIDLTTTTSLHVVGLGTVQDDLAFSADCSLVAFALDDRHTRVHDLTGQRAPVDLEHTGSVWSRLVFSPDNTLLAAGANNVDGEGTANDANVEVFGLLENGRQLYRMYQYVPISALTFDPTGRWLAVALGDTRFRRHPGGGLLYEARTGREHRRLHHDYQVVTACFDATGSRVMFAGEWSARVFDTGLGEELVRVDHEDDLAGAAFTGDGDRLVTVTQAHIGPTRVFRSRSVEVSRTNWEYGGFINVSPDGSRVFASLYDYSRPPEVRERETVVLDPVSGQEHYRLRHHADAVVAATSADGGLMALTQGDEVRVYPPEPALVINHERGRRIGAVSFTSDGGLVTTAYAEPDGWGTARSIVRVTDLSTGVARSSVEFEGDVIALTRDGVSAVVLAQERAEFALHRDPSVASHSVFGLADGVERCRFQAWNDGQSVGIGPGWIAALSEGALSKLRLDGSPFWTMDLSVEARDLLVSPRGTRVVFADRAGPLTLVDTRRGTTIATYETRNWGGFAFSQDDRRLAFVSDSAASVADTESGELLCLIEHEGAHVFRADFTRQGHLITFGGRDMRVSHVDTASLVAEAKPRLVRDLTPAERRRYRL